MPPTHADLVKELREASQALGYDQGHFDARMQAAEVLRCVAGEPPIWARATMNAEKWRRELETIALNVLCLSALSEAERPSAYPPAPPDPNVERCNVCGTPEAEERLGSCESCGSLTCHEHGGQAPPDLWFCYACPPDKVPA